MNIFNTRASSSNFRDSSGVKANSLLLIVPALLFIYMLFRMVETHSFFQVWLDPVYAYLMNGLTFALGSTDVGHIDHPGTPLQLFIALLIKIMSWFRGTDDLATDVLTHPESYLKIISLSLVTINCIFLWLLGYFANKNLKNISLAMVLQLVPIATFQLINFLPIVACESVVIFSSFAIAACIILYDSQKDARTKLLVFIAILSALSVATKISSLAILIVPFFFFKGNKLKFTYALISLVFIFLFISPVLGKMSYFTGFLSKMATHTGKYGSGEARLFDYTIFIHSIQLMLSKDIPFTLHVFLLPIGWILIVKRKIGGSAKRLFLAITLATVFQILLVARHYSFHYLMPVFALFMPLQAYFWINIFRKELETISRRFYTILLMVLISGIFSWLIIRNDFIEGIVNPVEQTSKVINSELKGTYIILTDYSNGFAFIHPALKFGLSYSGGSMKQKFAPILASAYDGNYFWTAREGLSGWLGNYLPTDVFSDNPEIYLYANAGDPIRSNAIISEMVSLLGMSQFLKLKQVYQNAKTGETIVLASADTTELQKYNRPSLSIETNVEDLSQDGEKIKSDKEEYSFAGGRSLSQRYARSGKSSVLLTPSNPFGMNISFPLALGRRYKLEFWQRSSDDKQVIVVATASQSDLFYKTSVQGINKTAEWTRSELSLSVPDAYPEDVINFYLYTTTSDSVWIDDFRIMIFE